MPLVVTIAFACVLVWLVIKIGLEAFKWFLVLAAVCVGFWFFTYGGVKIEKPSNMPALPTLPLTK
jgi:H+/gluconate symporter-like permease